MKATAQRCLLPQWLSPIVIRSISAMSWMTTLLFWIIASCKNRALYYINHITNTSIDELTV